MAARRHHRRAAAAAACSWLSAGTPLVVIRFDHPDVDYQQILYAALNQALQNRPSAGFQVVAVSPTRGNAASVQIAQTTAAPPCPGSDAFHDRHGRARHPHGRGLDHRSRRRGSEVRVFVR